MRTSLLALAAMKSLSAAREITFRPISGYQPNAHQFQLGALGGIDVSTGSAFLGLTTFANLPHVHCLAAEGVKVAEYDVAILGAPFDTGVTSRPGARYGPMGIRQGSRRISPGDAWSIYTGA
jgi:agmatinase